MIGHLGYPYVRDALIAVAYGLMLPAIAVLHVQHAAVRQSGAMLGTIAGVATVTVGLAASVNVDLEPAGLLLLGMWWWTIGKMWVETRVFRADAGISTAAMGLVAIAASVVDAFEVVIPMLRPDLPYVDVWRIGEVVLGAWLIALALHLRGIAGPNMRR